MCSTPEAIKADFPSLEFDLLKGVSRRLKRRDIAMINSDDVASWMDDHGGYLDDPTELAEHFKVDYIVSIDLERFTYKEENSPSLLRGRTTGNVYVFEVVKNGSGKRVRQVFEREYVSVYPEHHPYSTQQISEKAFRERYLKRVSSHIAQLFYDHRLSEEIY